MAVKSDQSELFGGKVENVPFLSPTIICRILAVAVLLVIVSDAQAVRRRVIFQLSNLHQWAELEYRYDGSGSNGSSSDRQSHSNTFEEKYHLDIDYVILGRRLANGSVELDLGFDQSYEIEKELSDRNDEGSGFNLEYAFDMRVFERSSYPVTLQARRHEKRVDTPFTKNYDLVTQQYSMGMAFKNFFVPAYLNYHYSESETDGLKWDRFQSTDEVRLSSFLKMGDLSSTDLTLESGERRSRVEGLATDTATDSYSIEANNVINWNTLSQRQVLRSSYRKEREVGSTELESEQWDERLRLRLGRGLETEYSHGYSNVKTSRQFRREQKDKFWVEHRLFNSLVSRYQHNMKRIDFDSGIEKSWSRQMSLSYTKKLPKDSRMRLAYSHTYGETDRDLVSSLISIGPGNPEVASIDDFFEVTLENTDVIIDSIVVRDEFGVIPASSYEVVSFGSQTRLDFRANPLGLGPGDEVRIEYNYNVNNSIEYSTTTHAVATSLDLYGQLLRIYANYSKSDQDLISGSANVSSLVQQNYYHMGIEGQISVFNVGGNYAYLESTINTEEYIEAFLKYRRERKGRQFSLRLLERFSTIEQHEGLTGTQRGAVEKNSLQLHMNYRRQLARNTTMTLKMFLADIRGDNIEQDEVSFGLVLESRWYKFLLRISADLSFEFYEDRNTHEEQLSIALRRYF